MQRGFKKMESSSDMKPLILCLAVTLSGCDDSAHKATVRIEQKDGTVKTAEISVVTIDGAEYLMWTDRDGYSHYCPKMPPVAEKNK